MVTLKCLAGLLLLFSAPGFAQPLKTEAPTDYPSKPIRIVVGFTPGGGPGITARYIAQKLSEVWKQRWALIGIEPRPNTPEEFDRLIRDEVAAFSRIAGAANIKVD